jgi:hypothetical protein
LRSYRLIPFFVFGFGGYSVEQFGLGWRFPSPVVPVADDRDG